ncbi:MAG: protein kinase domain-containing protein [Candidatus Binataceae bacterium]
MLCGSCGSNNSEGRGFCGQCGTALEIACAVCGASNRADEKFCGGCGKSLGGRAASSTVPSAGSVAVSPPVGRGHPESIANGRYRVRRLLGEGGSKIAYLAHDEMLDRDVAVSLFRVEGLDDAGGARVLREARAMGRLGDHPHIVGIYDIGEAEQGRPYIVSQYVPGGSLSDLLRRSPDHRLPAADAIRIAEQLCHGIEYAHSLGIVHRDIKPANVFLASDGAPLLGDFGLAVAPDQSRITAHGMMVGTAAYMPPEQALGRALEPRSDLYSFGAMLYESLAGRPPFIGDDLMAIISQHVNAAPEPPSTYAPGIPAALDALVLKLLAKSPAERPLSAAAVRDTLHTIAGSSRGAMDQLASTIMVERPNLSSHAAPDGTVSIMFSDIENSTLMIERLGDLRAQEVFRTHNRAIREQVARHGGYEVKSMGDGFMIAFSSARRALLCAVEIQRWLAEYSKQHPDAPLRVRIGLNTGEAIHESGDFFGKTVVLAARIGAAARGGEILVSSTFKEISASAGDIRYDAGRDMSLKGLAGSYRVYRALWASAEKKCPKCAGTIPATSTACPHCEGKVVELAPSKAVFAAPAGLQASGSATVAKRERDEAVSAINVRTGEYKELLSRRPWRIRTRFLARTRGRRLAVAGAILLLILTLRIFKSRTPGSAGSSSPSPSSVSEPELPTKAVPVSAGANESSSGPALKTSTSSGEKHAASAQKKLAVAALHAASPELPKSKTTIISSSADSSADQPEDEDAPSADVQVSRCKPTPHRYNIQVDSMADKTAADEMVHRIADLGFNACEKATMVNGQTQYAVRIGPYDSADQAAAAQDKLHEQYKAEYSEP